MQTVPALGATPTGRLTQLFDLCQFSVFVPHSDFSFIHVAVKSL